MEQDRGNIDKVVAKNATRRISKQTHNIEVLAFDGCSSGAVFAALEIFAVANYCRARIAPAPSTPLFSVTTVSPTAAHVTGSFNVKFAPGRHTDRADVLLVPPIWHSSRLELLNVIEGRRRHVAALAEWAKGAPLIASSCSGSVLLAEAGLLGGRTATTCWWLGDWFRQRYENVRLKPDEILVRDRGVWTAGAGSAHTHLCLRIIEKFAGLETARCTSRYLLEEPNRNPQAAHALLEPTDARSDPLMHRVEVFLEGNLARAIRLGEIAAQVNVSVRTLIRHFHRAKGVTPLAFLQTMRLARAKKLLAETRQPVKAITLHCGYEDAASFRKLFRSRIGITPDEYRRRFTAHPAGRLDSRARS
jgi:transcriptional regulator GlxA family with amidase domain